MKSTCLSNVYYDIIFYNLYIEDLKIKFFNFIYFILSYVYIL